MTRLALLTLCVLAPVVAWAGNAGAIFMIEAKHPEPMQSLSLTPIDNAGVQYAPGYLNGYIVGTAPEVATTTTVRTMPDLAAQLRAKARALDAAADVLEGK